MGVYKVEATAEDMKKEAVQRLKALGVASDVVRKFDENNLVLRSCDTHDGVEVLPAGGAMEGLIEWFQDEYQCLAYHGICNHVPGIGVIWSLLFVSPASSDWESERRYMKSSGMVYAYISSDMEDGVNEIVVEPANGGLRRLG